MPPVLRLDPAIEPTRTIGALPMFRDQSFEPHHQAGMAKQIRTDLALLERREVDAVDAPCQQPVKVGLAHAQGKLADSTTRNFYSDNLSINL